MQKCRLYNKGRVVLCKVLHQSNFLGDVGIQAVSFLECAYGMRSLHANHFLLYDDFDIVARLACASANEINLQHITSFCRMSELERVLFQSLKCYVLVSRLLRKSTNYQRTDYPVNSTFHPPYGLFVSPHVLLLCFGRFILVFSADNIFGSYIIL